MAGVRVTIEEEQYDQLEELAARTGSSVTELVNRAIAHLLKYRVQELLTEEKEKAASA